MHGEPDRALLLRFARGDREAFEAPFRHFEREVCRWIVQIVQEPAAAEDALVEAFWGAYRGHARFDPSRSFGAWMRRIATNVAIDQLNAARRHNRLTRAVEQIPASALATGAGPVKFELRDRITRAFASLPPKLRVVATLAPIGTVKSRSGRLATDRGPAGTACALVVCGPRTRSAAAATLMVFPEWFWVLAYHL